ncbi:MULTISPECIES: TetR/AcrR family transcriptional regulator [unclassified Bradyrhizobium]
MDSLFYREGIRAVGMDKITEETGISKRTLYNYFPSKDHLITAYLARRLIPISISEKPAEEQILESFVQLERSLADEESQGCPFVNAVVELKDPDHAANELALAFKNQRRNWLLELLGRLQIAHPERLATQLMLLIDGAIAATVIRRDPTVARAAWDAARVLLAAAAVDSPDVLATSEQSLKRTTDRRSARRNATLRMFE